MTEKTSYGSPVRRLIGISLASSSTDRPGAELTEIPLRSASMRLPVLTLPPRTTNTSSSGSAFVGTPACGAIGPMLYQRQSQISLRLRRRDAFAARTLVAGHGNTSTFQNFLGRSLLTTSK